MYNGIVYASKYLQFYFVLVALQTSCDWYCFMLNEKEKNVVLHRERYLYILNIISI